MRFLLPLLLAPALGFAAPAKKSLNLTTPRGAAIVIDLYDGAPAAETLVLLAPGQGCSARLEMYDRLATEAAATGHRLARLYWAYCVKDPQSGQPSEMLENEIEDYETAIAHLAGSLNLAPASNFMDENYPTLAAETRPVLLVNGTEDPLCETPHLLEFLAGKPVNFKLLVTKGNHALGMTDANGVWMDAEYEANLKAVARWIFSWL